MGAHEWPSVVTEGVSFSWSIFIGYCGNKSCLVLSSLAADIFFTFPPAGPQTKGLVKQQADFPTQFDDRVGDEAIAKANGWAVVAVKLVRELW